MLAIKELETTHSYQIDYKELKGYVSSIFFSDSKREYSGSIIVSDTTGAEISLSLLQHSSIYNKRIPVNSFCKVKSGDLIHCRYFIDSSGQAIIRSISVLKPQIYINPNKYMTIDDYIL